MIAYNEADVIVDSYTATIYIGTKVQYTDEIIPDKLIFDCVQEYVDKLGLCVTITPTSFLYTKGNEVGFSIGLINYPRFPAFPQQIKEHALRIARLLLYVCKQYRVTVVCPDKTIMLSNKTLVKNETK